MNEINELFLTVNRLHRANDSAGARQHTVAALKSFSDALTVEPQNYQAIAYAIAGLMATDFAMSLKADDPLNEIFTIAGELEIMPDDASKLLKELQTKIDQLLHA